MKKNILKALVFIPFFLLMLSISPLAADEQRLFDDVGYFSAAEAEKLNSRLLEAERLCGFYVSVLITGDIGQVKTNMFAIDYADVYYEEKFGKNTDGVLYMLNFDTNYDHISMSGSVISLLSGSAIEEIFDYIWDDILAGRYYDAMVKYCEVVEICAGVRAQVEQDNHGEDVQTDYQTEAYDYSSGDNDETNYDYSDSSGDLTFIDEIRVYFDFYFEYGNAFRYMAVGGVVGLVIAGIITLVVFSRYKIKPAKGAEAYLNSNSVRYHQQTDTFLRRYVTARRIETSNSGGGGTHTSSGGGTHGGGGRSR